MKITFEEFYLTDDRNEILQRLDNVEKLLQQTYWAQNRCRELIIKSIENSICYAVIDTRQDTLVAFARVITDYATLYCLEDVIVDQHYRNKGLGQKILSHITQYEEQLKGQFGVALTRDAQGFYAKYGFKEYYDTCMYRRSVL